MVLKQTTNKSIKLCQQTVIIMSGAIALDFSVFSLSTGKMSLLLGCFAPVANLKAQSTHTTV